MAESNVFETIALEKNVLGKHPSKKDDRGKWILDSAEAGIFIMGQFEPEDWTENISSEWKELSALNQAHPLLQFVGGGLDTFTFGARLWAENKDQDIIEDLFMLKTLLRRLDDLKRPPICTFSAGSQIFIRHVVIRSLGGIKVLGIRPDGKIRGISMRITLLRYVELGETIEESTKLPKRENLDDIKERVVKTGESPESIAKEEYQDPLQGVNVRKTNKVVDTVKAGDLLKIYPPSSSFMQLAITPDSTVLGIFQQTATARNEFFDLRNRPYFSPFIKW